MHVRTGIIVVDEHGATIWRIRAAAAGMLAPIGVGD
jgi:hypothetical protein